MTASEKKKKGFAALSPERRLEIAKSGGRAAHASGNAHRFTSEEARLAGKKGGTLISADREHMSRIRKIGGVVRKARRDDARSKEPADC